MARNNMFAAMFTQTESNPLGYLETWYFRYLSPSKSKSILISMSMNLNLGFNSKDIDDNKRFALMLDNVLVD